LRLEALEDRLAPAVLFNDFFDNGVFGSSNWAQNQGVTLDVYKRLNPPSGAYAARFDGSLAGGELLGSTVIDLSNETGGSLSYYYERTGGGAAPAAGDDLVLEYRKPDGTWAEIDRQVAAGPAMTTFSQRTISLPQDALYNQFQFRFRTLASGGDWFLDNVNLATSTGYGDYWSDLSWYGDLISPTSNASFTFPNTLAAPTGNGSLTIISNTLASWNGSDYLALSVGTTSLGRIFTDAMPQHYVQQTVPIAKSLLQSLVAGGSMQLTISPSPGYYSQASTVTARLDYPTGTGYLPPAVDLNGPSTSGSGFTTTWTGSAAVAISDPTATITATVAQPDPATDGIYAIGPNFGIYRVNPSTGASTYIASGNPQPRGVAVDARGDLVVAEYGYPFKSTATVMRVNPLSGSEEIFPNGDGLGNGIGANRKTGDIYYQDMNYGIVRIDPATGAITSVGGGSNEPGTFTVDPNGTIVDGEGNSIVRIDPSTRNASLVSQGGLLNPLIWGTAVEASGTVLAAVGNTIVQVNPATGAQSLLTHDGNIQAAKHVIVTDSGALYVLDGYHHLVQVDPVSGQQTLISTDVFLDGNWNLSSLLPGPTNPTIQSATITITNPLDGSSEVLAANTSGTAITASYDAANAVLHLTGAASPADYQKVLRTVTYNNTAAAPNLTARFIQVIVNDGSANSAAAISTVTISATATSALVVSGFPSPTTAGAAGTITVTAKDNNGNVVAGYTGTVHFKSSDSQAVLPADYTFTAADAGVHTFNVTLKTAGSQSLTATDTAASTVTGSQTGIAVNPAAASTLVVSGFPSPITAGTSGSVTVTARDPYGNTATAYTGTAHFTSSDSQAVLPADYAFAAADAGVHSFSVTLKTAGSQSITATDVTTSSIAGAQVGITVNPAAADHLAFAVQPSNTVAGVAISPAITVQILDKFNNLVTTDNTDSIGLAIGTNPSSGTLSGTTTLTASGGVATFSNLSINKAGSGYTLSAASGSLTGAASASFAIAAAAASTFNVTGFPSPVISGQAQSFTVTALDAFGNTATGYAGTVRFTSTDTAAVLQANYAFQSSDAGVHTFSATLQTAGTQSLTATDAAMTTVTGTQAGILVKPASFLVNGFPSPTTAGVAQTFSVTAQNADGSTATGYTGTVHFTSSDAQAVLPGDYTFTSTDAGVHTFSATLKTAGSQTLTAADTGLTSVSGTQSAITVTAAAASQLAVTGYPSPTVAGVAHTFTVTAEDPYGNTAAAYLGTVKFSSSDRSAALPATYTFISSDNGVHAFSATFKTAASQSLTATDTVQATITGTQAGIAVNPAAAKTFTVAGFTSPTTAGDSHGFTVTAKDPYGNLATGYTGTVHFTSSDRQALLPGNYTFLVGDAGIHAFSATLKTAGTQSITARDTVTTTIVGTQTGIKVNPAVVSQLKILAPRTATAGSPFDVTVTAQDAYGNTTPSYTGTVHFTSTDARGTLPADYTFTSGDAGQHLFSSGVTFKTAGARTVKATDTATSSIAGSATLTVVAAAASSLAVSAPTTATAGTAFTFTVTARDPYGNKATGYRGTVHFTSTDPQAVLPADYTFTATDNGAHSFSNGATLKTAGTQSLTATDTVSATITGQATIHVNAAAASVLLVSGFPTSITAGTAASFTVTALDAYGNIATTYRGTVHFSSSDGNASLPANYTFTATDAGVHTFTATLNTSGTQSLTGTDTLHPSITGTESGIQVAAAPSTSLPEDGLPDTDDGEGRLNRLPEVDPVAVGVVLADWPEDLEGNVQNNRVAEALFSRSADPADANQGLSVSEAPFITSVDPVGGNQETNVRAGVLAALAIPYVLTRREEHKRRRHAV
jgi:hypothetical protein